jgi:hypothetical protein
MDRHGLVRLEHLDRPAGGGRRHAPRQGDRALERVEVKVTRGGRCVGLTDPAHNPSEEQDPEHQRDREPRCIAFVTKASSYYRWMPLGQETGVFGTRRPVTPEAVKPRAAGRLGPTSLSARLDRPTSQPIVALIYDLGFRIN